MSHSPEPWSTEGELLDRNGKNLCSVDGIFDANGNLVADAIIGRDYCENAEGINAADMERIVACVNELASVPSEVLKCGTIKNLIDSLMTMPVKVTSDSPYGPVLESWLNHYRAQKRSTGGEGCTTQASGQ